MMKSENQLILNMDKKLVLKNIIQNMAQYKENFSFHLDFETNFDLNFAKFETKIFNDMPYQVFHSQDIMPYIDDFFLTISNDIFQQEFSLAIYDDFSSYIQMFTDFELTETNYCFNLNFYNVMYDELAMNPQRFPVDTYYFIPNAYTLDICTTVSNPGDTIIQDLAIMLGLSPRNDFNHDEQLTIVNFNH